MILVGLGNTGQEYLNTRHNIGFNFIDLLADKSNIAVKKNNKLNCDIGSGMYLGQKVTLCKPTTYMNLSGNVIQGVLSFYKIPINQMIVIHDEIDFEFGVIKNKFAGSSAGHNGIRSIDGCVGNKYHRIRIGIGRPKNSLMQVANFVLQKFELNELEVLRKTMDSFLEDRLLNIMCAINAE